MKGRLIVITGCMSSGKTEELLRLLRRESIVGRNSKIFKYYKDDRAELDKVESRMGLSAPAEAIMDGYDLAGLLDPDVEVVAIEEAQFFDYSIVDEIPSLLERGITVYITGLNQDFRGEPFGIVPDLMAMADTIVLLTAICKQCGADATMTQRLIDGKPAAFDSPLIMVGGDESYEARCRDCHEVETSLL